MIRFLSSLFAILLLALLFVSFPQKVSAATTCTQHTVDVTLSPSDPTVYHLFGELCWKGSLQDKTVQLVVHGITYDHNYWDWPQEPQKYSYVRNATDQGYVTFNIDRIGDGASDHPTDGTSVTVQSGAFVLHQIIQKLRLGNIGGESFTKILAVGHSFGSATAAFEAATYHDVDALILSGYMHDVTPGALSSLGNFYPAFLDPKFANSGLNSTYFTTMPGVRAQFFFNTANADPAVIAKDEELKQTATLGEFSSINDANALTPQINVPVLLAMGDTDFLFCDPSVGLSCANSAAILAREGSHYSAQTCLEALVRPITGHDLNLHNDAHQWFESATIWADKRVGRDTQHPPTQPCL